MFTPTSLNETVGSLLDRALVEEREKQPRRNYLGASRLGEECSRKLFYEYSGAAGRGFTASTYRIFDFGHDGEKRMADNLRYAGFNLLTEKEDGSQFGFGTAWKDGIPRISGHIDGALISGPLELPFPLLWECKTLGNKSFDDVVRKGVKASKPVYYAQMMVYCAYLEFPAGALFMALNRDKGTTYSELVPFDAEAAQRASDRGVSVISAKEAAELPRIAGDETDFRCRFCDYSRTCWDPQANRNLIAPATPPAWLVRP